MDLTADSWEGAPGAPKGEARERGPGTRVASREQLAKKTGRLGRALGILQPAGQALDCLLEHERTAVSKLEEIPVRRPGSESIQPLQKEERLGVSLEKAAS